MTINGHEIAGRMPPFTKENREKSVLGLKDQTRRPMKVQPPGNGATLALLLETTDKALSKYEGCHYWYESNEPVYFKCPYKVGDIRVMCEPLFNDDGAAKYCDDGKLVFVDGGYGPLPWRWKVKTLNTRYMPHEAARYLFEITEVRAERLQDICEEDARAEGCENNVRLIYGHETGPIDYEGRYAVERFENLWDSIYGKTHPWAENKMVWVYTYKAVE